jgi:hypothetical protein
MPFVRGSLLLAMIFALAVPAVAAPNRAADPEQLGVFRDWTAFTASTPEGRVCYALSSPIATLPKKAARDKIYVIISVWPSRGVRDELQIVPGYLYRDGDPVFAQVGMQRTEFFTRNDGKSGSAWVKEISDENALVAAMRGGATLTVSGVSKRGTKTTDTYSLSGIASALDRAHQACGK